MDAYQTIITRRSIRKYTDKPIADLLIEDLLKAAMQAPSAHNRQPWEFVVISDKALLEKIPSFHPYAQMCQEAPLAILVCGNLEKESDESHLAQNCSAAIQNILLAAHSKGLGSVWSGIYNNLERISKFKEIFHLPKHIIPIGLVVLGYGAEKKGLDSRFDAKKIHRNQW